MKKLLSIVLILCLSCGLLPLAALASDDPYVFKILDDNQSTLHPLGDPQELWEGETLTLVIAPESATDISQAVLNADVADGWGIVSEPEDVNTINVIDEFFTLQISLPKDTPNNTRITITGNFIIRDLLEVLTGQILANPADDPNLYPTVWAKGGFAWDNLWWICEDDVLHIFNPDYDADINFEGSNVAGMPSYVQVGQAPWVKQDTKEIKEYMKNKKIREIYIWDGIKNIGSLVFSDTGFKKSYPDLQTVTFASKDLQYIDVNAFHGNGTMDSVLVADEKHDNLLNIDITAFHSCHQMTVFEPQPSGFIARGAFTNCASLLTFSAGDGLRKIEEEAFSDCVSLYEIDLPDTVKNIGENAFLNAGLESFTLPSLLTSLSAGAFDSCKNLIELDLASNKLKTIGQKTFANLVSLESVIIPDRVASLGEMAFTSSVNLKTVLFEGEKTSFATDAFKDNHRRLIIMGAEDSAVQASADAAGLPFVPVTNFGTANGWRTIFGTYFGVYERFYIDGDAQKGLFHFDREPVENSLTFYFDDIGNLQSDTTQTVTLYDKTYDAYFDSDGIMARSQIASNGIYYDEYGMAVPHATLIIDGKTYRTDAEGKILKDQLVEWVTAYGEAYTVYYDADGAMATSTLVDFYDENGAFLGTRYFDENGWMATGAVEIDGRPYIADENGFLRARPVPSPAKNGWLEEDGAWYYYIDGVKQKAWLKTTEGNTDPGGLWYYLDPATGELQTGWVTEPAKNPSQTDTWYYLRPDWGGALLESGWFWDVSYQGWYYLKPGGAMAANEWIFWNNNWYYLGSNGKMFRNTYTPDGYWVDETGRWIP